MSLRQGAECVCEAEVKLRSLVTRSCCCCVCCSFFLFLRRLCCTRGRATAAVRRPLARSLRLFLPPSSPPSAGFFAVTVPGLRLSAASLAHRVERQPGKCVCVCRGTGCVALFLQPAAFSAFSRCRLFHFTSFGLPLTAIISIHHHFCPSVTSIHHF